MAAEQQSIPTLPAMPNTLLPTAPLPHSQQFTTTRWRIADGRCKQYLEFESELLKLARMLGITMEQLLNRQPPDVKAATVVTKSADEPARESELARLELARVHWLRINTAIYWHVLPMLDLAGDMSSIWGAEVARFVGAGLADGRGLVAWARQHADVSGDEAQHKLRSRVMSARTIDKPMTVVLLLEHCIWLHRTWELLVTSPALGLRNYYSYLVASLPTKDGDKITLLRVWLVDQLQQLADGRTMPEFAVFEHFIIALKKRALAFGIPLGTESKENTELMFNLVDGRVPWCSRLEGMDNMTREDHLLAIQERKKWKASKAKANDAAAGKSNGAAAGKRLTAADNACEVCDSWVCKSSKAGGPKDCRCDPDSTFPTASIASTGARVYVEVGRAYRKKHPNVKSIKGLTFSAMRGAKKVTFDKSNKEKGSLNLLTPEDELRQWLENFENGEDELLTVLECEPEEPDAIGADVQAHGDHAEDEADEAPEQPAELHDDRVMLGLDADGRAALDAERAAHQLAVSALQDELEAAKRALSLTTAASAPAATPAPVPPSATVTPLTAALTPFTPRTTAAIAAVQGTASRLLDASRTVLSPVPLLNIGDRESTPATGRKSADAPRSALTHMAKALLASEATPKASSRSLVASLVSAALRQTNVAAGTMVQFALRLKAQDWAVVLVAARLLSPYVGPRLGILARKLVHRALQSLVLASLSLTGQLRRTLLDLALRSLRPSRRAPCSF